MTYAQAQEEETPTTSFATCHAMPTHNLNRGQCQVVFPRNGTRNQKQVECNAVVIACKGRWTLSRTDVPLSMQLQQQQTILRYDDSIQLRCPMQTSTLQFDSKHRLIRDSAKDAELSHREAVFQLSEDCSKADPDTCADAHTDAHATENDGTDIEFVGLICSMPVPLASLSLVVEKAGTETIHPLLLSCWKRQLAGCVIAFDPESDVTSAVQVSFAEGGNAENDPQFDATTTLRVQHLAANRAMASDCLHSPSSSALSPTSSAMPLSPASSSPPTLLLLYKVLPSTRITITTEPEQPTIPAATSKVQPQTADSSSRLISTLTLAIQSALQTIPIPRHIMLSGPPGTGKTYSVGKAIQGATEWLEGDTSPCGIKAKIHLQSIRGSELSSNGASQITGATSKQLQNIFERAATLLRQSIADVVVLFFDECDALFSTIASTTVDTFCTLMDQASDRMLVWAATNRIDSIPQRLRRRLEVEFAVGPPGVEQRYDLLRTLLPLPDAEIQQIAELSVGFVPADLVALVRKLTIANTSIEQALLEVGASALRGSAASSSSMMKKTTWDDVAGPAKTVLRQCIEGPRRAAFRRLGLTPPRGILLHGPPGCAKTTLARAAANANGMAFLSYAPADVYASSYVGEAESVIRRAFALARSVSPCILFLDEMDVLFDSSGGRGNSAEARVLSTFLNEMDGVDAKAEDGVLVLGATNRPWTLDAALLRPGRLGDKIIYVAPPDAEARQSILRMQLKDWGLRDEKDLKLLASDEVTGGFTGAEIIGGCQEAGMKLIRNHTDVGGDMESVSATIVASRMEALRESFASIVPLLSKADALEEFRLFDHQHITGTL